ncbi:glucose/galactose MFS transporter, partial [Serratia sp. Se-RSBMAAmG]|nr:glucose/galactose MFS transporter [Serratia sp. Se-RSBMAAmG]
SPTHSGQTLWQNKHFVGGVIAQIFYVAAQVGVGAFFINYTTEHWQGVTNQSAAYMLSVGMVCFMLGRFFSTWLMGRVSPALILAAYALINIVLCAVVMLGMGDISVIALVAIFFFMSTMFPTIFAMGVKNLGPATKQASSFMIMAIVGGAIMPWFMGRISDTSSTALAYGLPLVCFAVVLFYALSQRKSQ